ncbi:MAG: ABC transporter permease, partial [Clostridia bacterium]|nr:ABC transporter permease [Clostridia bacterium]
MPDTDKNVITQDLFVPASDEERLGVQTMREPVTFWQDAWRRFRSNKVAMVSAVFIIIITLLAIFGPMFSKYAFDQQTQGSEYIAPFVTAEHPFGTDNLGRDLFVRLMIGARISLAIGIVTSIMVVIIGVLYGTISAYFGGVVDAVMMRIVDVLYAVPTMLIIILLQIVLKDPLQKLFAGNPTLGAIGPGLFSIFITLSLLYWLDMARMVRGQILSL